jgi:hypothetical protein
VPSDPTPARETPETPVGPETPSPEVPAETPGPIDPQEPTPDPKGPETDG